MIKYKYNDSIKLLYYKVIRRSRKGVVPRPRYRAPDMTCERAATRHDPRPVVDVRALTGDNAMPRKKSSRDHADSIKLRVANWLVDPKTLSRTSSR